MYYCMSVVFASRATNLVLAIVLLRELQDAIAEAEDVAEPAEARVVHVLHADRLRRARAARARGVRRRWRALRR